MFGKIIEINEIGKLYNAEKDNVVKALQNISFTIKQGEFVAVVGKSGAGKSTLMHILACVEHPTRGSYYLNGVNVWDCSDRQRAVIRNKTIGTVFQDFALIDDLNVYENVEIPLLFTKKRRKQRSIAVKTALKKVEMSGFEKRSVTSLSGGQKQRVAIARAIVNSPDLLLADEPTGALDSKTGETIFNLLKTLNQDGVTVFLITHDLDMAHRCSRQIELSDGAIIGDRQVL